MSHHAEQDAEGIALVQAILTRKAEQDAPDTWTAATAPGGWVCDACGLPTESEPCQEHQPYAYGRMVSA